MEVSFKFPLGTAPAAIIAAISAHYGNAAASVATVIDTPHMGASASTPQADPDADVPNPTPPTVDSEGLPHDLRIHSESKAVTDKGVWRKRRGVDAITIANVTAELRGNMANHPGASQALAQASQPLATPPAAAPAAPAMPALSMPTLTPPAPAAKTAYQSFVEFLVPHMHSAANPTGRITEEWVGQCIKHFGVFDPVDGLGKVAMLQGVGDDKIAAIRAGIAQSLGLPQGS